MKKQDNKLAGQQLPDSGAAFAKDPTPTLQKLWSLIDDYGYATYPIFEEEVNKLIATQRTHLKAELLAKMEAKKIDMGKYEADSGGIDAQIFDEAEDPRGVKNGAALAQVAQFASDQSHNDTIDEIINELRSSL